MKKCSKGLGHIGVEFPGSNSFHTHFFTLLLGDCSIRVFLFHMFGCCFISP